MKGPDFNAGDHKFALVFQQLSKLGFLNQAYGHIMRKRAPGRTQLKGPLAFPDVRDGDVTPQQMSFVVLYVSE